ncbi:MAG: PqqD family protein [Acidobacteria bacterium]|nr:PqqD family protein [Acidobacteriota bacterium]
MSAQPGAITKNPMSTFSFTVNPEAVASIHDDGIAILHTGVGRLFTSNGTGARIWRGVERRLSLESIAEELSGEYNIARATAREDVARFLAELERQTLIQRGARHE